MRMIIPLLLVCLAAGVCSKKAPWSCFTKNGPNLYGFNGRKREVNFPCKYWALHNQTCGDYTINVSPTNIWLGKYYQLDALWLGVAFGNSKFEGRTTNKIAVKAHNSGNRKDLFNEKGGDIGNSELFETDTSKGAGVWVKSKDGQFKITYYPWDPNNRAKYRKSRWSFECFVKDMPSNDYPQQMCGGATKKEIEKKAEDYQDLYGKEYFNKRFDVNLLYVDTFSNKDIAQTDPLCQEAVGIFTDNLCKDDYRFKLVVMNNCADMLFNTKRTECITSYNCSPMEAFNACLRWGCIDGFQAKVNEAKSAYCEDLSERIFFCPAIKGGGNLTERAKAADCYKDFPEIIKPQDEADPYDEEDTKEQIITF